MLSDGTDRRGLYYIDIMEFYVLKARTGRRGSLYNILLGGEIY